VRVCMDLMRVLQKLRADYWMQHGFVDVLTAVHRMCWISTPNGDSGRAQFIRLQGCDLLMEVLGDGTAASRPVDTVYRVLYSLYTLCGHDNSKSAVKELPAAGKDIIKRALITHADYLKKQDWWTKVNSTAKLLETLNA